MDLALVNRFVGATVDTLRTGGAEGLKVGQIKEIEDHQAFGALTAILGIAINQRRLSVVMCFDHPVAIQIAENQESKEFSEMDDEVMEAIKAFGKKIGAQLKESLSGKRLIVTVAEPKVSENLAVNCDELYDSEIMQVPLRLEAGWIVMEIGTKSI